MKDSTKDFFARKGFVIAIAIAFAGIVAFAFIKDAHSAEVATTVATSDPVTTTDKRAHVVRNGNIYKKFKETAVTVSTTTTTREPLGEYDFRDAPTTLSDHQIDRLQRSVVYYGKTGKGNGIVVENGWVYNPDPLRLAKTASTTYYINRDSDGVYRWVIDRSETTFHLFGYVVVLILLMVSLFIIWGTLHDISISDFDPSVLKFLAPCVMVAGFITGSWPLLLYMTVQAIIILGIIVIAWVVIFFLWLPATTGVFLSEE